MKPLVIYHADCTDGYGAAFAAWMKLGDEAEYLPWQYGKEFQYDVSFREVYILDFSFPLETMEKIFAASKRVVWLDHHKTAAPIMEPHVDGKDVIYSETQSGAMLAWEYFHPDTAVPSLIRHIDDRDRWQFKLSGSRELHAALASYKPWSFAQWNLWLDNWTYCEGQDASSKLFTEGSAILRAQDAHVKSMLKQARKCSIRVPYHDFLEPSYAGLALNTPMHMSEAGHELANTSGTFGLVWYLAADGRVKASLRSNGDYDVSRIAKAFGGGGHKNAAGFEIDIETLMEWLK